MNYLNQLNAQVQTLLTEAMIVENIKKAEDELHTRACKANSKELWDEWVLAWVAWDKEKNAIKSLHHKVNRLLRDYGVKPKDKYCTDLQILKAFEGQVKKAIEAFDDIDIWSDIKK